MSTIRIRPKDFPASTIFPKAWAVANSIARSKPASNAKSASGSTTGRSCAALLRPRNGRKSNDAAMGTPASSAAYKDRQIQPTWSPGMLNSRYFRAVLAVALILATSPLASAAEIIVNLAPPAPVVETAPPAPVAPGYWVWRPGFWRWDGRQYVWVPGRYVHPPYYGAVWVPGHWDARRRGWVWIPGAWRRG